MIYIVNNEKQQCMYCREWIVPYIERSKEEIRTICPKCNLTLEIIRKKKVII